MSPRTRPAPGPADRVTYFIGGAARSGSTVLGSLVSQATGAFDCGELHLLWPSLASDRLCSCGAPIGRCAVWSAVAERALEGAGLDGVEAARRVECTGVRQRDVLLGRAAPPTRDEVGLRSSLEEAIRAVTGCRDLVDSSKLATVAQLVVAVPRPVRLVHLVRHPCAVAFSWSHPRLDPSIGGQAMWSEPAVRTAAAWAVTNLALERVCRRRHRGDVSTVVVRYEDLAADPAGVVARVCGAPPPGTAFDGASHAIAGNPARFEPHQRVEPDRRWEREMRAPDRALVHALTSPLRALYGYR